MVAEVAVSGVNVVLASGDPAIVVDSVSVEGDRLCVRGRLLGTMQSKMYVGPKEVLGLTALALRGSVLLYLFLLPYFYLRRALGKSTDGTAVEG